MRRWLRPLILFWRGAILLLQDNQRFLQLLGQMEGVATRVLAIGMLIVVIVAIVDLGRILATELLSPPLGQFSLELVKIFGLFLNVLVALEILENITAYLKTHVSSQIVELVIVTSLIAIARKLIILDISQPETVAKLLGLAIAILALSASYWIVRRLNYRRRP
ncbi:MAG: phosphate-starvation-inducible PsiE family protein [Thermosynechococcus sp. Uc]|uniref:phosphate-starvation-inducible PsiE family protein n=1 Tax=Thermosynechococcus sp. Uc TaxID=3034853 RepID=UPI00259E9A3E|nr:phosphate-starvation-inducible PsiE family protein [Thermosynechococcus sp. Uc]MDM7326034.1 phosphate-starvation-inducible PsiE family protein [Thermosynechococcus sp. Uc]